MPVIHPACPLRLKKGLEDAVRRGMPWIYTDDIVESSELMLIPAGSLVAIESQKGQAIGTGYYNARSRIACRVLALGTASIDGEFFRQRMAKALALRDTMIGVPYYRLVHSEPDLLPGLLVDRFGDTLVVQVGTAGMDALQPLWMDALEGLLKPNTIVLRNDTASRTLEGLPLESRVIKGALPEVADVQENGFTYRADLLRGQKTGWFYDQRDNRNMIAGLAQGQTLLDVYSHSGGFGLLAAKRGAKEVTLLDSSKLALELATSAADHNKVAERCRYVQADAFDGMAQLAREGACYDIVLADPPAFVKTKKDIAAGLKGYEKVARLAAALVKPGGRLFMASCSHHAGRSAFNKSVVDGVKKAGFTSTILKQTGASPDHPRHPLLPQSEYLKGILLQL